ncbi:MAG: hypothetical protein F4047_12420, partial [Caldilineaceae bacterium SB0670_bin_27]|nr:hypothetical protein [Caldilineaceae bacterium SB0670_bin_27]
MKIKNCVRFLLTLLLLTTASTPVLAQTPDPCASVEPLRPGDTVTDIVSDVSLAHVDITEVETSLAEETLTVVFHLSDLPDTLRFNRTELGEGTKEYEWEVAIDVDNDRSTGPGGFDTLLTAYHIAFMSHEGTAADVTAPIGELLEVSVWEINPDGSTSTGPYGMGSLTVSAAEDTITMTGVVPGITSASRLTFEAYDAGYPDEKDWIECHDPFSMGLHTWPLRPSNQCDSGEAVRPGQGIVDEAPDDLAAHVDVTEINTSLSGETLTVVFHLRDLPETLTFARTGVPADVLEYSWEVSIDVDADQETGYHGFEYILSSISVSHGVSSDREQSVASAADDLQTNTWRLETGGSTLFDIDFFGWARIELSAEEDTVTLSGEIPGITAESQLAFGVYDYLGGSDEVGCLTPFGLGRPSPAKGPSDGSAATPSRSASTDESREPAGHADIRGVTTTVDGETLTVTL